MTETSGSMSVDTKREWIGERLRKADLLALDFEVNLLISAAESYKCETVLKPFPTTFLSESTNDKNYKDLLESIHSLPPVNQWYARLSKLSLDQLSLIYWLLMSTDQYYQLKYCSTLTQADLKAAANYLEPFAQPNYCFELNHSDEKNRRFDLLKQQTATKLGVELTDPSVTSINFHGTRMDNVYSILHMGLLSHFSKNALFGEGTYLSQEPSMSLHYSPSGKTWDKSFLGQRMSCMLVCETINHPDHVKISTKDSKENGKASVSSDTDSHIPDRYFVVKNNDYVRIKYVLLYAERSKKQTTTNWMTQLISENKFAIFLVSYCLLMLFVGCVNSRSFHKYFKMGYATLTNFILGVSASPYGD